MKRFIPFTTVLSLLLCLPIAVFSKEVSIPINLDYQLLKALVIQTSYTNPDQTAQVVNEADGCIALTLSNPEISGGDDTVHFGSDISVHVGTPIGSNCLMPYQWNGSMIVSQIPKLDPQTWELSFEPVDTKLISADGRVIESFNLVWEQLLPIVKDYFSNFSIKLDPPINDLKHFILPMFTVEAQKQAEQLLDSIRPGTIDVQENKIRVTLLADAFEVAPVEVNTTLETLSENEIQAFLELWETWDSLLVYLISFLAEKPLSEDEKQQLIDLLLDTRYEFVTKINDPEAGSDFVRDQFIDGWQQLSLIFRNHLLDNPSQSRLGYLSFFTAVDALMILDELGPAFGVEISRNGLVRLAKILGGESVELNYTPDIDKTLQQLFDAHPSETKPSDNPGVPSDSPPPTTFHDALKTLERFVFPEVHAASLPTFLEIKKWQPPRTNRSDYLSRVTNALNVTTTSLVIRRELPKSIATFYQLLIPAIAWQESCFRQFVVKKQKLTYLLSYNQSSVGIMQVNERVWRGVYDTQRLRWDIKYNISAGCEIVDMYLQKYALKKYGKEMMAQTDTLAQMVYAMYNGGPSQHAKFLERKKTQTLYKSDLLFAEKFESVKNSTWQDSINCL